MMLVDERGTRKENEGRGRDVPSTVGGPACAEPPRPLAATEFFLTFFAAWTLFALGSVYPGHVHYDTIEVAMWSTLELSPGYFKHPPLLPWLFKLYGVMFPLNWVTLTVLAGLNITVGAYAVWRIGCLVLGEDRAPVLMAIHIASPLATWSVLKLDHNAILVSLWPLVIWAFLLALRQPTAARGAVLGIAAAAALLAKYSSALLLVALGLAAVLDCRRWIFLRSPAPWVAAAVALVLIAPHAIWALSNPAEAFGLVTQKVAPGSPVQMALRNLALLLPPLCVAAALYYWNRGPLPDQRAELRIVAIAVAVPYVATLVLTAVFGLRGSPAWATPVFAVLAVLLAATIAALPASALPLSTLACRSFFIVVAAAGPLLFAHRFVNETGTATEPRQELAARAIEVWRHGVGKPLQILAGEHRFAMAAHLLAQERPRVWPRFELPTPWINPGLIDRYGMLGVCLPGTSLCKRAAVQLAARGGWSCTITARRAWLGRTGPETTLLVFVIPPRDFPAAPGSCPP